MAQKQLYGEGLACLAWGEAESAGIVQLEDKAQGGCYWCAQMPGAGTEEDRARLFSVIPKDKRRWECTEIQKIPLKH